VSVSGKHEVEREEFGHIGEGRNGRKLNLIKIKVLILGRP
jgi:hypothetical protein